MFANFGELNWVSYTVQAGDTLSKIASKYGSTVEAIAGQNNIDNPDYIQVGQQLDIPVEDKQFQQYMNQIAASPPATVTTQESPVQGPQLPSLPAPTVVANVGGSTLPVWLQGDIGGIKKIYAYPLLLAIGAVVLITSSSKSSTKRISLQPA